MVNEESRFGNPGNPVSDYVEEQQTLGMTDNSRHLKVAKDKQSSKKD